MRRRHFIKSTGVMSLSLFLAKEEMRIGKRKEWQYLGQPCRNFNILAKTLITDPLDGKEKLVLSNFASSETGSIILIDVQTGKGENFQLPVGEGAWGLVNWHNEKLIIGTCTGVAYLHVFDLKTRTFAKPLVGEGESYFWQMASASDDKIYGGTYPGCVLFQFDPKTNTLVNLGKVSDNPKNLYSRNVFTDTPGYVFIYYGLENPGVAYYDIHNKKLGYIGRSGDTVVETNETFVCLKNKEEYRFYSVDDFSELDDSDGSLKRRLRVHKSDETLMDGRTAGYKGQEYYVLEKGRTLQSSDLKRIPVDPSPTRIFNLTSDAKGMVWGACGFGLTVFNYNPKTQAYWNSPTWSDGGGEVYGMVFYKGKLYTSAYAGGDHAVFDPNQPWNAFDNINPYTFASVKPDLIRPEGRTILGPDGGIWTGWSAKYGIYGGGLSRVEPGTLKTDHWYDPVPQQQIAGLTADSENLYFTTNGGASGLPYNKDVRCHFVTWKPGEGIINDVVFDNGETLGLGVFAHAGLVALVVNTELKIYSPAKKTFIHKISLDGNGCRWMIPLDKKHIGVFAGKSLYKIHVADGSKSVLAELPDAVDAAMIDRKGRIYFSVKSKLYALV